MMEIAEKPVDFDLGMEGKEILTAEIGLEIDLECCRSECKGFESRSKKAEDRCAVLEQEIERRKIEFELLEGRFIVLEFQKNLIEDEVKVLKERNAELEKRITKVENEDKVVGGEKGTDKVVDLTENGEDKAIQLMAENKVLECEKKIAENEVEIWKQKCGELESRLLELEKENLLLRAGIGPMAGEVGTPQGKHAEQAEEGNMKDGKGVVTSSKHLETESKRANRSGVVLAATDTPPNGLSSRQSEQLEGRKRGFLDTEMDNKSLSKRLVFGDEDHPSKKLAPSTPAGARPTPCGNVGIIYISDSDDGPANEVACISTNFSSGGALGDVLVNISKQTSPLPKRRRASNIITTDSESDDDDGNVLIRKLQTKNLQEFTHDDIDLNTTASVIEENVGGSATPRRRLVALRNCNVKIVCSPSKSDNNESVKTVCSPCKSDNNKSNGHDKLPENNASENDEMEEDGSESSSEGESLGGFIVESSDTSEADGDGSTSSVSEDASDDNVDYKEVISRIRRNTDRKIKWEFEADMLAAFGNDTELCMKGVCALYRQQTSDEQFSKWSIHSNQRGFSQSDAHRGSTLADFLTGGDPDGDVRKSVEQLREFDPSGPEVCRTLATRYSKQLFAIYKSKEDPLFLPS